MIIYGTNNIYDFIKNKTGKTLKTYQKGKNGEFIENDWADKVMQRSKEQLSREGTATAFWSVLFAVRSLIDQVEKLPKTEDNKEFFQLLPKKIKDIFDLKIPMIKLPEVEGVENIIL